MKQEKHLAKKKKSLARFFQEVMSKSNDVRSLNNDVIIPFIQALEEVADSRNYTLNIYGNKSNLIFTNEKDAEKIYNLVEEYLDKQQADSET